MEYEQTLAFENVVMSRHMHHKLLMMRTRLCCHQLDLYFASERSRGAV